MVFRILCLAFWLLCVVAGGAWGGTLPDGFVYCEAAVPGIVTEMRYATAHNFTGAPVEGYLKPRCILTGKAALALKGVQDELRPFGLGLKVFDAYRPQRAVDNFVRWAKDVDDTRMKREFYPEVSKKDLFVEDYIAARSGHSRGSTVDLTLVALNGSVAAGRELDMGTPFDFFGPESWPAHADLAPQQRANRLLLQQLMRKAGFRPYSKEWWHFTLELEPFPDTYFNFPVQ